VSESVYIVVVNIVRVHVRVYGVNKRIGVIRLCVAPGVVVSALGMRTRRPWFESRVVPLFHRVATLGKSFRHIASPVSQLQETAGTKGSFQRLSGYGD